MPVKATSILHLALVISTQTADQVEGREVKNSKELRGWDLRCIKDGEQSILVCNIRSS